LRGLLGPALRVLSSGVTINVYVREPNDARFFLVPDAVVYDPASTSARLSLEASVGRIRLPGLNMANSIAVARRTVLRVDVCAGRKVLRSVSATLASLIWESEESDPVDFVGRKWARRRVRPDVEMRVKKWDASDALAGSNLIEVCASVSSALRGDIPGKRIAYSISKSITSGGFKPVFRSEILGSIQRNGFVPAELAREALLGCEQGRILRIALHVASSSNSVEQRESWQSGSDARRAVGYADVDMSTTLPNGKIVVLPWTMCFGNGSIAKDSFVFAGLEMKYLEQAGGIAKISLVFKQARQIKAVASDFLLFENTSRGRAPKATQRRYSCDYVRHAKYDEDDSSLPSHGNDLFHEHSSKAIYGGVSSLSRRKQFKSHVFD
jgi:hypothetical protein